MLFLRRFFMMLLLQIGQWKDVLIHHPQKRRLYKFVEERRCPKYRYCIRFDDVLLTSLYEKHAAFSVGKESLNCETLNWKTPDTIIVKIYFKTIDCIFFISITYFCHVPHDLGPNGCQRKHDFFSYRVDCNTN